MIDSTRERAGVIYALAAVAVVMMALAGFIGFRQFPKLGLPGATGAALLGFAAAAGIASFFSPCSFPLLVMLLTRQAEAGKSKMSAIRFAAALSAGAAAFLVLLGAGLGAGGSRIFEQVTFTSTSGRTLRLVVGVLLLTLGAMQAGWLRWPLAGLGSALKKRLRITSRMNEHPTGKFALFGFFYLLAGFG